MPYPSKPVLSKQSVRHSDELVWVDTAKADAAWRTDPSMYIPPGGTKNTIRDRYPRAQQFLSTSPTFDVSEVSVYPNGDMAFGDGRHRFASLRDAGHTAIPVAMSPESVRNARKAGMLVNGPVESLARALVDYLLEAMSPEAAASRSKPLRPSQKKPAWAFPPEQRDILTRTFRSKSSIVPRTFSIRPDEQNCLGHSERLKRAVPGLRLVKGWARFPGSSWGAHQWCVSRAGKIIDPYFEWAFGADQHRITYREAPKGQDPFD